MENEIPRRIRLDLNTPAELAIYNAMQEVENVGADVKLTEAVILLSKARDLVADYVDSKIPTKKWTPEELAMLKSKGYTSFSEGYASGENKHLLWKGVDNMERQVYFIDKEGWNRDCDGDWGTSISRDTFYTFGELISKL